MLANGIKLYYKETSETDYTQLTGLNSVPELGNDPEKVECTTLEDNNKQYEYGIGDYGDLDYTFNYVNDSATAPYRVMRAYADAKTTLDFKEEFPDGTTFTFKAQCSVKVSSGEVNGLMEFTLSLALSSDMDVTDPA